MITLHNAMTIDELALVIEQLSREVSGRHENGLLNIQDAQQFASLLTQMQLVLNELERTEIRERGVNRQAVERFVALEQRIRSIQGELYGEPQHGRPARGAR